MKTLTRKQILLAIGKRINEIRSGNSQEDFANDLNTIKQTISKYENGKIMPGGDFMLSLIEKKNVSIDWLLTGEGEMLLKKTPHNQKRAS